MKMNKQVKRKNNRDRDEIVIHQPATYIPTTTVSRKFRFFANGSNFATPNAAATFAITPARLGALQGIATAANTLIMLYETVKVKRVEVWASPPQSGGVVSVSVIFSAPNLGVQGSALGKSDYSMGMSKPAYVSAKPSRTSQAAQWQTCQTNTGNATLFEIYLNPNGITGQAFIIDITLTLRMTTDARTANNSVTTSGALTTGGFYNSFLDNNAGGAGTGALQPDQRLPSAF